MKETNLHFKGRNFTGAQLTHKFLRVVLAPHIPLPRVFGAYDYDINLPQRSHFVNSLSKVFHQSVVRSHGMKKGV